MKRAALLLLVAACGGSSPQTKTKTSIEGMQPDPTCQDLGDRTAEDMGKDLPESVPEDAPRRFGDMIAKLCTDDAWPVEVIACGMTAENPREECSPKLDDTQRAHIDEAQRTFTRDLLAYMHPPLGIESCDELVRSVDLLTTCPKAVEAMGEQLQQIAAGTQMLYEVGPDQHAGLEASCADGVPAMRQLVAEYGCAE